MTQYAVYGWAGSPDNEILFDIRDGIMLKMRIIGRICIMEQSTFLNRVIIIIILQFFILMLCACDDTSSMLLGEESIVINEESQEEESTLLKQNENRENYYTLSFSNTSKLSDLIWRDDLSFEMIQIKDMPEEKLQLQKFINANIKSAMTSWIGGRVVNAETVELSITCHSDRYLSFVNSFAYVSNRVDYINDYITIDMLTGERVLLNDLLEVDEQFVRYLKENVDKIKAPPNPLWQAPPKISEYTMDELLIELKKCSYTQEQLIEEGNRDLSDTIESLLFKNSFFLREGILVIIIEQGGESFITLDVEDIEDFLKVDKW
ncbi:hypothetical protein LJC58_07665 [Lachnospiraceae bacterium OttesenSCG-928-D06]|nr:hypothetical protein [Lachnospiraceae bacterium OttesenSCG-928-D06]